MGEINLRAKMRDSFGKGAAKRLRRDGMVPVVLYGRGGMDNSLSLSVDAVTMGKVLHKIAGRNVVIDLDIEGEKKRRQTVLKEVQLGPVDGRALHADLYELERGHKFVVDAPLRIVGQAKGVEAGGLLQLEMRKLKIECLPRDIPERIDVDVTALDIGDSIHVNDLKLSDGLRSLDDSNSTVVSVVTPAAEAPVTGAEEEEEESLEEA